MDESSASARLGALHGVRVLDLSRVLAGPLATQMMADHGATVIKIEPPSGDETRQLGPPFAPNGSAAYFESVNRGKQAMALDVSTPQGQDIVHRLLAEADVLIENFLPGTMQRWHLDYERDLKGRYPRLIYCSISGFGADGPLGGLPGYDAVLQAQCGLMSINGDPQSGSTRLGIPVVDHLTGYNALVGILMALHARQQSGQGQRVEATLFDTALGLMVPHAANWIRSGQAPALMGSAHPNIAVYDKYRCQDGEVFLGIINDGQFRRFCQAVGLVEVANDPRFASNPLRVQHRAVLRPLIEAALAHQLKAPMCQQLMQAGVPCAPVHSLPEAFEQDHAKARGNLIENGAYRGIASPIRLMGTPAIQAAPPPDFAQDTSQIMTRAGYSLQDIEAFTRNGVLPMALKSLAPTSPSPPKAGKKEQA